MNTNDPGTQSGLDLISRRRLLGAGCAVSVSAGASAVSTQPASQPAIERVPLGKTGIKVTRLAMGASFPEYGPRLLGFAYDNGIRFFDCSERYVGEKAEALLGDWVHRCGCREDLFIATRCNTSDPKAFYDRVAKALSRMKLDTVDMFGLHGVDQPDILLDRKGEWRRVKDQLVREKKIRLMGFSCHAEMPQRVACLNSAAKSGWVDAILIACDPGLIRSNAEFDKALDACAKAGIGLVAMKTARGLGKADQQPQQAIELFKGLGLSPHQAMQAGIWSDGRFATVCTEMPNRKIIEENCTGARAFRKPFDPDQWKVLDEGIKKLARATCPGCDGSCRRAAGTQTDFCSIARYLAYAQEDGNRDEARALYAELAPECRDWRGADLKAASRACRAKLDFEAILERAQRVLG